MIFLLSSNWWNQAFSVSHRRQSFDCCKNDRQTRGSMPIIIIKHIFASVKQALKAFGSREIARRWVGRFAIACGVGTLVDRIVCESAGREGNYKAKHDNGYLIIPITRYTYHYLRNHNKTRVCLCIYRITFDMIFVFTLGAGCVSRAVNNWSPACPKRGGNGRNKLQLDLLLFRVIEFDWFELDPHIDLW